MKMIFFLTPQIEPSIKTVDHNNLLNATEIQNEIKNRPELWFKFYLEPIECENGDCYTYVEIVHYDPHIIDRIFQISAMILSGCLFIGAYNYKKLPLLIGLVGLIIVDLSWQYIIERMEYKTSCFGLVLIPSKTLFMIILFLSFIKMYFCLVIYNLYFQLKHNIMLLPVHHEIIY
ncbi:uncharacterized protein LOC122851071 [Aphidius gifuensis]|uniref:uncharacterized protein LOC122851071 n=1 Tax=Aphidius gifuensis TaxID=684658 RepID=UPI001CDD7B28|nr:uncharacterized protein LOC122851071 [Aphidius gifuensis]